VTVIHAPGQGRALAGSLGSGVDPASLAQVATEVLSVHELGVEVAVVVGGGNYFRGQMAGGWGISRAEADNIGMLGTVMNALMMRGVLTGAVCHHGLPGGAACPGVGR
jgi:uridylate kinase